MTPSVNGAPLLVGVEEGIFARHDLAVTPVLVALMPNLPAALMSNSGQIGLVAVSTFIQAVDGGLDLVAIAGGNVTSHDIPEASLLVRPDFDYRSPADFIGRTIGVPGLGAPQHVFLRYWFMQHGVDPARVRFIETSFTNMADNLRSHAVDGVIAADPAQSQIISSGVGKVAVAMYKETPEGKPWLIYVSTRDWASAHPKDVASFRAAMAEAQAFTMTNTDKAKQDLLKYVPLPAPALARMSLGLQKPGITADGLRWWIDVMTQQQMLTGKPDADQLVLK